MTRSCRLYALLDRPWFYSLACRALAPGARSAILARIQRELAAGPAGRALDVGCGPRSWLSGTGVSPIGVDASFAYARALRRSGGTAVVARAEALPFLAGSFASVWCFGLLHHLSNPSVLHALEEAGRVAASGRLIIVDGVPPRSGWRRPIAWILRRLDRGSFLRSETALDALLSEARDARGPFDSKVQEDCSGNMPADWRLTRFTYSWTGLEGLWCVLG